MARGYSAPESGKGKFGKRGKGKGKSKLGKRGKGKGGKSKF